MNFSEFSKLFYKYIGKNRDYPGYFDYLLSLFKKSEDSDEENPFVNMDTSTKNCFHNGTKNISKKNASYIMNNFDATLFVDEIYGLSPDVKQSIIDEIKKIDSEIVIANINDVPDACADLFKKIIIDIADGKAIKNRKVKSDNKSDSLKSKYGMRLLQEVNNICPMKRCTKPLYIKTKNEQQPYYEVIIINPKESQDSISNMLAVCPDCATKLNMEKTEQDILDLTEIKALLDKNERAVEITSSTEIEEDIATLIQNITNVGEEVLISLNYSPPEIAKKFKSEEHGIRDFIKSNVAKYYWFIAELFKQKVTIETFNENRLRRKIKSMYEDLRDGGIDKETIFEVISDHFYQMTKSSKNSCRILTSFFIQSCEIFEEENISK